MNMIQQIYAGAKINLESTRTQLSAGIESIQNYVFFNKQGMPEQKNGNLQVINARIKQDVMYRAFGWETKWPTSEQRQKRTAFASNQPVYQYVSEIQGSKGADGAIGSQYVL